MFNLDKNQKQHLLVILNEINHYIYDVSVSSLKNKANKNIRKFELPSPITGLDLNNRQNLVEFILNSNRFFKTFFKYSSNLGIDSNHSAKNVFNLLSIFYDKILFEHLNFELMFGSSAYQNSDKKDLTSAKNKVILNGTQNNNLGKCATNLKGINANESNPNHVDDLVSRMNILQELHLPTSNQIYQQTLNNINNELNTSQLQSDSVNLQLSQLSFQQLNLQQLSNLEHKITKDDLFSTIDQHSPILYQTIKDLISICLLIIVIFYKLRHVFPNLINRYEASWKFLINFERELNSSFLYDSFLDFLQFEILEQRKINDKRTEQLKQEVLQLEKIGKLMEIEIENEICRLVQIQNKRSSTPTRQVAINLDEYKPSKGNCPCPECGKIFRNTYKLNRHLYVHKDPSEKPYVCDWVSCTYRSISRNDLNRHKMIHTGEKPYLCNIEGCEKRYSRPDKLRHHKKTIHFKDDRKKEQICIWPGCNFQCVTKIELNRHRLTHSLVKCEIEGCEQEFDKADKMKKHREKDHSKLPVPIVGGYSHFNPLALSAAATSDIRGVVVTNSNQSSIQPNLMISTNNLNSIGMALPPHISLASSANNVDNNAISTISSVPISVVASNAPNSNHRHNTVSVWSS